MEDLCPSQSEIKKMITRLQNGKAEVSTIDCKETMNLKEDGDCASFIRHICALANTGQKSYLLIGIEDKTWAITGIAEDSPMRIVDSTQQQMNQILAKRLDPPITVNYCTCEVETALLGVIALKGTNAPYIISIEDTKYGGAKTKGKESYVYAGVIYIRRGTDSIPINRQSHLLKLVNGKRDHMEIAFSLVFIGWLVAGGIGVGSSVIHFGDPYVAAILSLIWGIVIGWILNKRLVDAFGKYPIGTLGQVIKNASGPAWGGIIGAVVGYWIVNAIISNKMKVLDPILMGFFVAPFLATLVTILGLEIVYLMYLAISMYRKVRQEI